MSFVRVVRSLDFGIAAIVAIVATGLIPPQVSTSFAKDAFGIGISVLSIVFSVYFAALATIISSSDDDFVEYLQGKGYYSIILWSFKWTLGSLGFALIIAIVLYLVASNQSSNGIGEQSGWLTVVFCTIFAYSLVAAFLVAADSLKYAKYRAAYIGEKSRLKRQSESSSTLPEDPQMQPRERPDKPQRNGAKTVRHRR